jgi:hypothetical protein
MFGIDEEHSTKSPLGQASQGFLLIAVDEQDFLF